MSSFTDSALEKKLAELNGSQQSIQTLSLWLIHHRKHHKTIVQVWFRELKKSKIFRFSFDIYFAFHFQYIWFLTFSEMPNFLWITNFV